MRACRNRNALLIRINSGIIFSNQPPAPALLTIDVVGVEIKRSAAKTDYWMFMCIVVWWTRWCVVCVRVCVFFLLCVCFSFVCVLICVCLDNSVIQSISIYIGPCLWAPCIIKHVLFWSWPCTLCLLIYRMHTHSHMETYSLKYMCTLSKASTFRSTAKLQK